MNKYVLVIILCVVVGCASNPEIKSNNVEVDKVEVDKDRNVYKDILYYFWVVTGGM